MKEQIAEKKFYVVHTKSGYWVGAYIFSDQLRHAKIYTSLHYANETAERLNRGDPNQFCAKILEVKICLADDEASYRKQSENAIELPCKIGDTVYIIDEANDECGEDYVLAVKVLQFFINEHGIAIDLALPLGMRLNTWMVVGENVFLTEEEAENALAHMKGGAE